VDAAADKRYNPRMAKKEESKTVTFEEAVAQLEQIVAAIESGQIGLEESLAKYEQGMALVKRCRGILDRAEKRIEILNQSATGPAAEALDPNSILTPSPEEAP
jgi:exodeoxyribonuclease VII small subunit